MVIDVRAFGLLVLQVACSSPTAPAPPAAFEEPPPCAASACAAGCIADCQRIAMNRCLPTGATCEAACAQASARKQYDFSACIAAGGIDSITACTGSECYFRLYPASVVVPPTQRNRDRCGGTCTTLQATNCLKSDDLARCNSACASQPLRSQLQEFVTCTDEAAADCARGKGCLATFIAK